MIVEIENEEQISEVSRLINTSFITVANEYGFTKESVPTFPAFIGKEVIQRQVSNGLKLIGYSINEKMVGCIGIRETKDSGRFLIERLAVIPEFRHKKIGNHLMNLAISMIIENKGKIAQVEIVNENSKLKKWYIKLGFYEVRIDHYEHLPFTVGILQKVLQ